MGACSECVFPEHSRPIQPVASLTAIQVALNTMFVKHDGYRADGAEVQISFLYQFFTFTLTGYRTRAVLGFRGLRVARLMACGCWV